MIYNTFELHQEGSLPGTFSYLYSGVFGGNGN